MEFKLTIYPALEGMRIGGDVPYETFKFETKRELMAAKYCAADLLLFLQDKIKVMDDYSNIFLCEEFIDGEWEEIE